MTSGPVSPARSSASTDHWDHAGSSVITSSSTLESTRVAAAGPGSLTAGERHDLGRAQRHVAATAKLLHQAATAAGAATGPLDQHGVALDDELHLVARPQPQLVPHRDGDRHLALVGQ